MPRWCGSSPTPSRHLQKREGDAWVDQGGLLIICTMEIHFLGAGVVRTETYGVPIGLEAGTYRLRYRFVRSDGLEVRPVSNAFGVR